MLRSFVTFTHNFSLAGFVARRGATCRMLRNLPAAGQENLPQQPSKLQKLDGMDTLRVKKLSDNATLPTRGSAGAAGYDLARCGAARSCMGWTALNLPDAPLFAAPLQRRGYRHPCSWQGHRED